MASSSESERIFSAKIVMQKQAEAAEEYLKQLKKYEDQLQEKDRIIAEEKQRFEHLKDDFQFNLKLLEERDEELERYDATFANMKKILVEKDAELSDIKIAISEAHAKVKEEQGRNNELETYYQEKMQQLREEIETYRYRSDEQLRKQRDEYETMARELQRHAREKDDEVALQRRELTSVFEEAAREREKDFRRREDELLAEVRDLASKTKDLQMETEIKGVQHKESSTTVTTLRQNLAETEKRLKETSWALEDTKRMKDTQIKELQDQNQKLAELKDQVLREHEQRLAEYTDSVHTLERELARQRDEYEERLRRQTASVEDQIKDATRPLEKRAEGLTSQLQTAQTECERLREQMKQVQWECEDRLKHKDNELEEAQRELDATNRQADADIHALRIKVMEAESECNAQREKTETLRRTLEERKQDIANYKAELVAAVEREANLRKDILQERLQHERELEEREGRAAADSEDLIRTLQSQREEAIVRIQDLEAHAQELEAKLQKLTTEHERATSQLKLSETLRKKERESSAKAVAAAAAPSAPSQQQPPLPSQRTAAGPSQPQQQQQPFGSVVPPYGGSPQVPYPTQQQVAPAPVMMMPPQQQYGGGGPSMMMAQGQPQQPQGYNPLMLSDEFGSLPSISTPNFSTPTNGPPQQQQQYDQSGGVRLSFPQQGEPQSVYDSYSQQPIAGAQQPMFYTTGSPLTQQQQQMMQPLPGGPSPTHQPQQQGYYQQQQQPPQQQPYYYDGSGQYGQPPPLPPGSAPAPRDSWGTYGGGDAGGGMRQSGGGGGSWQGQPMQMQGGSGDFGLSAWRAEQENEKLRKKCADLESQNEKIRWVIKQMREDMEGLQSGGGGLLSPSAVGGGIGGSPDQARPLDPASALEQIRQLKVYNDILLKRNEELASGLGPTEGLGVTADKEEIRFLRGANRELNNGLFKAREDVLHLEAELAEVRQELSKVQVLLSRSEFTIQQRDRELESVQKEVNTVKRQKEEAIADDQAVIRNLNDQIAQLKADLQSARQHAVQSDASDSLKRQISTLQDKLQATESEVEKLTKENKAMKSKLKEATRDLKRLMVEREKLMDISNALKADLNRALSASVDSNPVLSGQYMPPPPPPPPAPSIVPQQQPLAPQPVSSFSDLAANLSYRDRLYGGGGIGVGGGGSGSGPLSSVSLAARPSGMNGAGWVGTNSSDVVQNIYNQQSRTVDMLEQDLQRKYESQLAEYEQHMRAMSQQNDALKQELRRVAPPPPSVRDFVSGQPPLTSRPRTGSSQPPPTFRPQSAPAHVTDSSPATYTSEEESSSRRVVTSRPKDFGFPRPREKLEIVRQALSSAGRHAMGTASDSLSPPRQRSSSRNSERMTESQKSVAAALQRKANKPKVRNYNVRD